MSEQNKVFDLFLTGSLFQALAKLYKTIVKLIEKLFLFSAYKNNTVI